MVVAEDDGRGGIAALDLRPHYERPDARLGSTPTGYHIWRIGCDARAQRGPILMAEVDVIASQDGRFSGEFRVGPDVLLQVLPPER